MKPGETERTAGADIEPQDVRMRTEEEGRLGRGMMTTVDCIPCFVRQALEAARLATDDPALHARIMREALIIVAGMDPGVTPPLVAQQVHRRLRELSRSEDPYRQVKDRYNRMALDMLPGLRAMVVDAPDPLAIATRLAIAGNVIDLGVKAGLAQIDVATAVDEAVTEPILGDMEEFRQAVGRAGKILYLADNAGEIVFDRLLIERLPAGRTTVAVRGGAVINDATLADAHQAGIHEIAQVMDNGSDAPGTVLEDCSQGFRTCFYEADVVIAKGQGNFETLTGVAGPIFFLFMVKCPVIAAHAALPVGTHVLKRFEPR